MYIYNTYVQRAIFRVRYTEEWGFPVDVYTVIFLLFFVCDFFGLFGFGIWRFRGVEGRDCGI